MISEPGVTLTDYGLAVESAVFAILIRREGRREPPRFWLAAFFASLCLAALLGGTVHGFFPGPTRAATALWRLTLLAVGLTALTAWGLGANLAWAPHVARVVVRAALGVFVIYAAIVVGGTDNFTVAIVHYLPATIFLALVFGFRYRRTRERGAVLALLGLVTLLAGSWVQWRRLSIDAAYLDHNTLYHLIEAVALLLLFLGARRLIATRVSR